jgi:hypothetical protein
MNGSSGQASGSILRKGCDIIWLPGIAALPRAAGAARLEQGSRSDSTAPARTLRKVTYIITAVACVAGQAAALPLLAAGGAPASPWLAGAIFGAAAAASSWAWGRTGARNAGHAGRALPAADSVLNNAFTLALVLAASAAMGVLAAALLLPAGALLAQAHDRSSERSAAENRRAVLAVAVALAMAGLLAPLNAGEAAAAVIALAAITLMKAGQARREVQRLQVWQVWGASALLCAAITAAGHGGAAGAGPAAGISVGLVLVAGAVYGFAVSAAPQLLQGGIAEAVARAVPFISAGTIAAFSGRVTLPEIAVAFLLAAAAAAGSHHLTVAPGEPAVTSPNGWPSGWF